EPIYGIVGDPDRIVLVLIGEDRQHRPENLLALDPHAGLDVAEHGGPHIVAAIQVLRPAEATRHQRGSLLDAALDQALDLVELDLAHRWSELRVLQAWIAHLVSFRGPLCYLQRLVMARCRHEHAGRRIAGLAAIAEAGIHALAHGALEVGVGQYDVCRFAAQLLRYALDRIGRRLGNDDSGAGRAREGDHVDIRMACHDLADI